jgi:pyruvate,water dikinase
LAEWLMDQGIESVSLNPDTVVDTWLQLAKSKAAGGSSRQAAAVPRREDYGAASSAMCRR